MLIDIESFIRRSDSLQELMSKSFEDVDTRIQTVFANQLVLLASGLIEETCKSTLSEFARRHGHEALYRFVYSTIAYSNSFNCEKIKSQLDRFDRNWWVSIEHDTDLEDREAIDSLKALRDKIAHGKANGTGFATVSRYYKSAKRFSAVFEKVVLG